MALQRVLNIGTQLISRKFHISQPSSKAVIIDGKKISKQIQSELKASVDSWVLAGNRRPKLVAVLVGNNEASKLYVKKKCVTAESIGIDSETITMCEDTSQDDLIRVVEELNHDHSIDGVLVQLPLPNNIVEREICSAVAPAKDVDGFHLANMGRLCLGDRGIVPATALAVRELISRSNIETKGKNAVVIGRSKHVGLPIALLLQGDGKGQVGALDMTTTICHRYTPHEELKKYTQLADVVISAVGIPRLLTKDMIKPGACVIDVAINRELVNGKWKLTGDVDFNEVAEVAGHITPVPGGVGPMTVIMLMKNTLEVSQKRPQQLIYEVGKELEDTGRKLLNKYN
ncbi:bifunctional methylenetetrahydrofolate dehydrogenase/cyclohydrolase, mitochondrial [Orussus abietinus]|uniref:bifunctional methylenetetrahydrofolate dehydrogenase/cyclohydrolase, mitochondrial n=1 Tax=Orussus abietinus TaxID=222816 RepID=UPI0006257688|nr:bifunctional methylenetetrahydrofolate dehydrogenase/cyclohydrolase, mitochondrial [Orussus abietinus]